MQILSTPDKIRWITSTAAPREDAFYPSLVKRLQNSDDEFLSKFKIKHFPVDEPIFLDTIFPLYEKEIVNRENYIFQRDELKQKYLARMKDGRNYSFYGFYSGNTLIGGFLYSIPENIISVGMRFFDRSVNKDSKSQVTLDFWAEWMFYDFIKNQGHKAYSLGIDHYPNIDRAGLPLYKLKVGSLPFKSQISKELAIDRETLVCTNHIIYFDDEQKNGQFKKIHCLYKQFDQGGILEELEKVSAWAGLIFIKDQITEQ